MNIVMPLAQAVFINYGFVLNLPAKVLLTNLNTQNYAN
jgi:hypothetical protein